MACMPPGLAGMQGMRTSPHAAAAVLPCCPHVLSQPVRVSDNLSRCPGCSGGSSRSSSCWGWTRSSSSRLCRRQHHVAAKKGSSDGDVVDAVRRLTDSVLSAAPSRKPAGPPPPQAIHGIIAALLITWLGVSFAGPSISPLLAYSNVHKHWWTFATDGLHSGSPTLLAAGLFLSYMFGRSLENSQGPAALLLTYLLACAGGCAACALLLPKRALLAGPGLVGALFGLFCGATLFNPHRPWHWQRVVELVAVAPYVLLQLTGTHSHLAGTVQCMGVSVGAWVPLLGGLVGAAVAAGLLALWRAVARYARQQEQQRQRTAAAAAGSEGGGQREAAPVESLIGALAAALLRRLA